MIPTSSFGGLNHVMVGDLNAGSMAVGMSAFGGKPESMGSIRALPAMIQLGH
jgi:hypothetical protein